MRIIRFPSVPNERIEMELERVLELEGVHATSGITGDLAHLANGDLRKALLLAEVLGRRNRLDRRGHVQEILTSLHRPGVQMMVEDAFRGRIHDWRWEKVGARNVRRLHGAMGWHDRLIKEEGMDALDIVEATHQLIIRGRVLYPRSGHGCVAWRSVRDGCRSQGIHAWANPHRTDVVQVPSHCRDTPSHSVSGRGRIRTRGLRLRRASHYPGYATRPAHSELPQIQWFRWVPWATWIAAPISAGGVSTVSDALPDPYGRGFDAGEDTVARVRSAWERREQSRLSAGSLARRPWQSVLRTSLGPTVLLIAVLRLIAPNLGSSGTLLIIYLMIHSVAALAPSLIATEMSFQALGARRSLREVGGILNADVMTSRRTRGWIAFERE